MERNIVFIALFTALVAALGLIPKITLAFGVPITAQSLGIMLCGVILGSRRGALAALLFVFLVALGLPLLAGGRGGLGQFLMPTAGFLIGFPFAAYTAGLIAENWKSVPFTAAAIVGSVLGGIVVLYAFGIVGLAQVLDKSLLEAGKLVLVFIPGDVIKSMVAGLVAGALYNARPQSVLARA